MKHLVSLAEAGEVPVEVVGNSAKKSELSSSLVFLNNHMPISAGQKTILRDKHKQRELSPAGVRAGSAPVPTKD